MLIAVEICFWVCLLLVAYAYVGYALIVFVCSRLFGSPNRSPDSCGDELPTVTILIAAHNEEGVIGARLENALALDYPPARAQIVVASDGSSDRTVEIVRSFADQRVKVVDYCTNRGKAATLNATMRELSSDVVLLSDANTFIEAGALRKLAQWFSRPEVGAVCGRLVLVDPVTGSNVDGLYWKYETFLKECEARLGALLGANGAIYAIRREAFVEIPSDTIVDDFVIPLLTKLKHGCKLIYEPGATAYEETPPAIRDEFHRRVRIGAGGFQSLGLLWPLLMPHWGWLAFSLFSHKLLRWLCPFFLLAMAVANLALAGQPLYQVMLLFQGAFYAVAWAGNKFPNRGKAARLVRLTTMFSSMNAALFVGFFRWLSGRQRGAWTPTARS